MRGETDNFGAGPSTAGVFDNDQPSTSAPNGSQEYDQSHSSDNDMYIKHTVNKLDTLAGLAIKYNVSVSDIKRINGLLSDTAMFARDTLLIPKHSLPLGQEYSAWAAMIITRHGRVSGEGKGMLSIDGAAPNNQAIEQLKRYYNLNSTPPHANGTPPSGYRRSRSEQSLLEMSSLDSVTGLARRGSAELVRGPPPPAVLLRDTAAADDRVRRRRAGDGDSMDFGEADADGGSMTVSTNPRTGKPQYGRPPSGSGSGAGPSRESLLQKVKRVASNPMLGAPASQISNAAEGVMSSIQPGIRSLKKMLTTERSPSQAPPPLLRPASKKD